MIQNIYDNIKTTLQVEFDHILTYGYKDKIFVIHSNRTFEYRSIGFCSDEKYENSYFCKNLKVNRHSECMNTFATVQYMTKSFFVLYGFLRKI